MPSIKNLFKTKENTDFSAPGPQSAGILDDFAVRKVIKTQELEVKKSLSGAVVENLNADMLDGNHASAFITSVYNLSGTTNQINLSGSGIGVLATRDITLSTPQDIATTSSPQFANLILTATGDIKPSANSVSALNIAQADGTNFVTFDTTNQIVKFSNGTNGLVAVGKYVVFPLIGGGRTEVIFAHPTLSPQFYLENGNSTTTTICGAIKGSNGGTGITELDLVADGATNSGRYDFYTTNAGSSAKRFIIKANGDIIFGSGVAGYDQVLTFDGETNDGVLTWMEDEDYFKFSDDILMNSTKRIYFNDTNSYIYDNGIDLNVASNGVVKIEAGVTAQTVSGTSFISDVAVGTKPYACTSTTVNTNLNADLLDGQHGTYYEISGASVGKYVLSGATTSATKEFFTFPCDASTAASQLGWFSIYNIGSTSQCNFNFFVPNDFTSLVDAKIVCIGDANHTVQWDVFAHGGAVGEAYTTISGSQLNATKAITTNTIEELNVSGVLAGIAANDYVGLEFQSDTASIYVVGLRIKYS
jgi:hypothetical protein